MQKHLLWFGFMAFVLLVAVGGSLFSRPQTLPTDSLISPSPTKTESAGIAACSALTLLTPTANQKVNSTVNVSAIINNMNPECRWTVFEGQAGTVEIFDENQMLLGSASLTTTGDWMTDQPVTYSAIIEFTTQPTGNNLTLKIEEEDPSGQGSAQTLTVPLTH